MDSHKSPASSKHFLLLPPLTMMMSTMMPRTAQPLRAASASQRAIARPGAASLRRVVASAGNETEAPAVSSTSAATPVTAQAPVAPAVAVEMPEETAQTGGFLGSAQELMNGCVLH